jgi:hypothetical protein
VNHRTLPVTERGPASEYEGRVSKGLSTVTVLSRILFLDRTRHEIKAFQLTEKLWHSAPRP